MLHQWAAVTDAHPSHSCGRALTCRAALIPSSNRQAPLRVASAVCDPQQCHMLLQTAQGGQTAAAHLPQRCLLPTSTQPTSSPLQPNHLPPSHACGVSDRPRAGSHSRPQEQRWVTWRAVSDRQVCVAPSRNQPSLWRTASAPRCGSEAARLCGGRGAQCRSGQGRLRGRRPPAARNATLCCRSPHCSSCACSDRPERHAAPRSRLRPLSTPARAWPPHSHAAVSQPSPRPCQHLHAYALARRL